MLFKYQFLFLAMLMLVILVGIEAKELKSKIFQGLCKRGDNGVCHIICHGHEKAKSGFCSLDLVCLCST